ncbi:hypothetical protein D3C76_1768620 [compost metagenome]
MGNSENRHTKGFHQPVTAEDDQGDTDSRRSRSADPPHLPLRQISRRCTRQFRRQAERRGKHEGGITGQAPEQAL